MAMKCAVCKRVIEPWEEKRVIGKELHCRDCFTSMERDSRFTSKAKKYFSVNTGKVILTLMLYGSVLTYNLVFFKPILNTTNSFLEIMAQVAYTLNYPIMFIADSLKVSNIFLQLLINLLGILVTLGWNYFIACEAYHLYKNIQNKQKRRDEESHLL